MFTSHLSAQTVSALCTDSYFCSPRPGKKTLRIAIMGGVAAGKTAIVNQFISQEFLNGYAATIRDRYTTSIDMEDRQVKLDIFDTPGSLCFSNVRRLAAINADAFVLVYSVHDEASFTTMANIRDMILQENATVPPMIVVGTKTDRIDTPRTITKENAGRIVVNDWRLRYIEASAKNTVSVLDIFQEIVQQTLIFRAKMRRNHSLPYRLWCRVKDSVYHTRFSHA